MARYVEAPNLPKRYTTITRMPDGTLDVTFISDTPGVRASGTYHFKPGSDEFDEIMRELGELTVGEQVVLTGPLSPEDQALLERKTPLDELKKKIIEEAKSKKEPAP